MKKALGSTLNSTLNEKDDHKACWQGRIDREDAASSIRIHQRMKLESDGQYQGAPVFIGLCSDEGVARNQGRTGAAQGPNSIRQALANLSCPVDARLHDRGNLHCIDHQLEHAQQTYANKVSAILTSGGLPIGLGGGHEIGWASFLGAQQFLQQHHPDAQLGIVNFDAHFDLRNPSPVTSSGTPFRQAQQWCEENARPFHYFVFGINSTANTHALFQFANAHQVKWIEDIHCSELALDNMVGQFEQWLAAIDVLYLTVCLDVFPAADAPGVSAPAALGVNPGVVLKLISHIKTLLDKSNKRLIIADVAEMNPSLDIDGRTARLAARIVHHILFG